MVDSGAVGGPEKSRVSKNMLVAKGGRGGLLSKAAQKKKKQFESLVQARARDCVCERTRQRKRQLRNESRDTGCRGDEGGRVEEEEKSEEAG